MCTQYSHIYDKMFVLYLTFQSIRLCNSIKDLKISEKN